MDEDDRLTQQIRDAYQRPLPGEDVARARVLERVRREPVAHGSGGGRWLRVTPLAAAASLIAVLALGAVGGAAWMKARTGARAPGPATLGIDGQPTAVTFVFRAPGASHVALVGDFNGWDPQATPLRRAALGDAWTAEVPLHRGLHVYAFVIDGEEWFPDPSAPLAPETGYGRRNSVVVVGEGDAL